jgi:hypothetical protein
VNEWGFAAEIKSRWDATIAAEAGLGLGAVTVEESTEGDRKRSDITLYDAAGNHLMVLELRLPDHPDAAPSSIANIENAMTKASAVGARWSATSDAETFRLLDHSRTRPTRERAVPVPPLATPATRNSLDVPAKLALIRAAWVDLLRTIAPVLTGKDRATQVPPDEFFVDSLRASLANPLAAARDAITERQAADTPFRDELIRWMVDEQDWIHDATKILDEIDRVAQVVTYVFATRLLFYGALRRAQPTLPALDLPSGGNPASTQATVESLFEQATVISGDYQTVFTFDNVSNWALISEPSCKGWLRVIELLERFELESIGYDILGRLFERLIDPHERHNWGQHYTSPDVVDLMLSAALPAGTGSVLDPACGGGTFLVRAYVRKRAFEPQSSHSQRLLEIFGCDISAFAASVSTVNLASQNLATGANYPQVRIGSFFRVFPGATFVRLPDVSGATVDHVLPQLDAVVCNPPYIGFSNVGADRRSEADLAYKADWPTRPALSHRFNYHLYFWFHAAMFLNANGRMSFITSGEWLDSDYGVQLQDWLTANFHVELVIESMAEPWFGEARVGTVVIVARRWAEADDKAAAKTRFAILRKPLSKLYSASTDDDTMRLLSVDDFRDRLMELEGVEEGNDFDHSVILQVDLRKAGTDSEERYVGSTWRSRYLRSPKIAEELTARDDFVTLGEVGQVFLGAKTGADSFFFVTVVEGGTAAKPRVTGLTSWQGQINRSNLALALRNPRDLDADGGRHFVVPARRLPSRYLTPTPSTRDPGLLDYVAHGETSGIHRQTLVMQNASERHWYRQVRSVSRAEWVLPYNSAYDYFAADNTQANAVLNGRFVGVNPNDGVDSDLLGAVLNSTFVLLARLIEGVSTGSEGAYDVGPPAVRLMRIPDPRKFAEAGKSEVVAALTAIRRADRLLPAPSSTGEVVPLRRTLDLAILRAMGESGGDAAVLLDRIYASYARWRASVEAVEDQVQVNRRALVRRGGSRAQDPVAVAIQTVRDEIGSQYDVGLDQAVGEPESFELVDAMPPSADLQDALLPQTVVKLRETAEPYELGSENRVEFARQLRDLGWPGQIPIPHSHTLAGSLAERVDEMRSAVETDAATRAAKYVAIDYVPVITAGVVKVWSLSQCDSLRSALPATQSSDEALDQFETHDSRKESGPSLFDADKLVPKPPRV